MLWKSMDRLGWRPAKGRAWCRSVAKRHPLSASLVTSHYTAWRREWWARPETPWWHVRPPDAGKNCCVSKAKKKIQTLQRTCFGTLSSNIYTVNGSGANIESRKFAGHLQNLCPVRYHWCMLPILGCSGSHLGLSAHHLLQQNCHITPNTMCVYIYIH